jgi:hypothetical protein
MMGDNAGMSSGPVDESARARPAPALLPYVAHYSGYRQAGVGPATHRGLPSPFMTLIFTLDEPLAIAAHPDPRQAPGRYDTLIGGLHTRPALVMHDGWQSGIQVGLSPLGARSLLGLPAGELAEVDLDAADLLGPFAREIRERVRAETTWPARFAVLDRMLLSRIGAAGPVIAGPVGTEVGYAWRRLLGSGGTVRVSDLAAATGWSAVRRRHGWRTSSETSKPSRVVRAQARSHER